MKKIAKRLGLAGLVLGASTAIIAPTNIGAFYGAKDRLAQYGTVNKAIEAHEKEFVVSGFPYGQIHALFFEIGENVAYRQHSQYNKE